MNRKKKNKKKIMNKKIDLFDHCIYQYNHSKKIMILIILKILKFIEFKLLLCGSKMMCMYIIF